jgi:regulator of sigma E protease
MVSIMSVIQNLPWVILLLGALVFFHELGHFLVAKLVGVKVLKFSLGFGPKLFGFTRGETEYVVSALPLGGFVKMLGEVPGVDVPAEDLPRAFSSKSLPRRAAIVLAGPAFNFLLAFLVYVGMFTGVHAFGSNKLGIVSVGEPAWKAGLRPGDVITAIDGKPVDDFDALRELVSNRPGERLRVVYTRNGVEHVTDLHPDAKDEANVFQETETRGRIGVSPQYVKPFIGVVDPESPAAKAGLKTGDLVVAVNGAPVATWYELREAVGNTTPGSPVLLRVDASGKTREVAVQPGAPPQGLPELASAADTSVGYTGLVSQDVLVDKVEPGTPAARLGLAPGDRLLKLRIEKQNGQSAERPINIWTVDLAAFTGLDARSRFVLTFQHGREVIERPLSLEAKVTKDELKNERTQYVFGATNAEVMGTYTFERNVGLFGAIHEAGRQVVEDTTLIGAGITKIVQGRIPFSTMGGPIMLFVIAKESAKHGIATFLRVMAVVSVNLGVLNLLPVPVLDGGHLLFFGIEAVRRRPPSLRTRELANIVGLALLALLMVLVFKNDILRYVLG